MRSLITIKLQFHHIYLYCKKKSRHQTHKFPSQANMSDAKDTSTAVRATSIDHGNNYGQDYGTTTGGSLSPQLALQHGDPEFVEQSPERAPVDSGDSLVKKTWRSKFAFFRTKEFWFILLLGQILAICITGTNTLTTLLVIEGTSIPAFQTFFNYVLLNLIYTSYTIYKYGFKKWGQLILKDGWKCESQNQ